RRAAGSLPHLADLPARPGGRVLLPKTSSRADPAGGGRTGGADQRVRGDRRHRGGRRSGAGRRRESDPGPHPAHPAAGDRTRQPARVGGTDRAQSGAPNPGRWAMSGRTLVVRSDNFGDVLLTGPAVRVVAAQAESVVMLAGPRGAAAAHLLPGVDQVVEHCLPWIDPEPPAAHRAEMEALVDRIAALQVSNALIFTSFHQSPLPLALLLRMAGVEWIGAISEDYPGSLLDLRHRTTGDPPAPERALSLARAAGYSLPAGDDGSLAVR